MHVSTSRSSEQRIGETDGLPTERPFLSHLLACYVRVLMASDIKGRIVPASQAYYKLHDIRLVHFGLPHKKPTEAHRPSVLVIF